AGEDAEICYLLRLAGYRLWYDDRLKLKHFIPGERLTWDYLRALWRGFGEAGVYLDPYKFLLAGGNTTISNGIRIWPAKLLGSIGKSSVLCFKKWIGGVLSKENPFDILLSDYQTARCRTLWAARRDYSLRVSELKQACKKLDESIHKTGRKVSSLDPVGGLLPLSSGTREGVIP
ncbi:MAG: hypothetical protein NC930_08060, partial [Candidatus Omnitrophica bacterium]|nr:hypothetical protein [Candidatus Omnitrophota bacterium]